MSKSNCTLICTVGLIALCQAARADGLLAMVNPAEKAMPSGNIDISVSSQYFEATDYTSMRHFSDDWRGSYTPRNGENLAVSFARAEVSARQASWSVGYFFRQDVLLESNKDMTDIVHANKTGTPVPIGNTYDFTLDMNGFQAHGVRLDKAFVWNEDSTLHVAFGVGVSLLKGQRTRMGQAQGTALSTVSGYTYDANLTDADSLKTYPFMPPGDVSSSGYALDLGWHLQWQDGKRLDIVLNDLLGEIRWKNLPSTALVANSANATYDAQGYISFNPSVSGQNSRFDITQKLDTKGSTQLHAPISGNVSANLGIEWIKDNIFPRLGLAYAAERGIEVLLDYDIRFSTIGLGANWKDVYLAARTQSLNLDQSRGYGIEAGFKLVF